MSIFSCHRSVGLRSKVNAYLCHVRPDIVAYVNDCVGEISQQVQGKSENGLEFMEAVFDELIFRNSNYESYLIKWKQAM